MIQAILAAILVLMPAPSPKWEETQEQFKARMTLIAQSIAEASKVAKAPQRRQMAMAIVVTFWGESRFSPLVQAGGTPWGRWPGHLPRLEPPRGPHGSGMARARRARPREHDPLRHCHRRAA